MSPLGVQSYFILIYTFPEFIIGMDVVGSWQNPPLVFLTCAGGRCGENAIIMA